MWFPHSFKYLLNRPLYSSYGFVSQNSTAIYSSFAHYAYCWSIIVSMGPYCQISPIQTSVESYLKWGCHIARVSRLKGKFFHYRATQLHHHNASLYVGYATHSQQGHGMSLVSLIVFWFCFHFQVFALLVFFFKSRNWKKHKLGLIKVQFVISMYVHIHATISHQVSERDCKRGLLNPTDGLSTSSSPILISSHRK